MTCHESAQARRKKKLKAQQQQQLQQRLPSVQSPQLSLDKSLPSLPVDDEVIKDNFADTPTELSPPPQRPSARPPATQPQPRSAPRQPDYSQFVPSPQINRSYTDGNGIDQNLRMPQSYNRNRHSHISHASDVSDAFQMLAGGDPNEPYSFIPLVLDPSPGPLPSQSYRRDPSPNDFRNDERAPPPSRSFTAPPVELPAELPPRSEAAPRNHIAYQEKTTRQNSYGSQTSGKPSADRERVYNAAASSSAFQSQRSTKAQSIGLPSGFFELDSGSPLATTPTPKEEKKEPFKLGEVPRNRKAGSKATTPTDETVSSPTTPSASSGYGAFSSAATDSSAPTPVFPPRGDSTKPPPRIETTRALESPEYSGSTTDPSRTTSRSNSSGTSADYIENSIRKENSDSTLRTGSLDSGMAQHPPRTSSTAAAAGARASPSRELAAPRTNPNAAKRHSMILPPAPKPPGPPGNAARSPGGGHSQSASLSVIPPVGSPVLQDPLKSPIGGLSMEEDFAKIFGEDNQSAQLFRRVSNAVRHGRSYSDLAGRITTSPVWPRSPSTRGGRRRVDSYGEITSPIVTAESKEENAMLKNELRLSSQRIAELESRLNVSVSTFSTGMRWSHGCHTVSIILI